MDLLSPIKDHYSERRLFIGRVAMASTIGLLLLGAVVARLVQLQIFDHEMFAEQSQGNRFRIEAVPPTRGLIFDRKGRVLAENLPAYQLELIPEQVYDLGDTLTRLAELELIAAEDIESVATQAAESEQLATAILQGIDANENGIVEPFEGECGLAQIPDFGIQVANLEIFEGSVTDFATDS